MLPLKTNAEWDNESHVRIAKSDDVAGLAIEASTMVGLVERLKTIIPELIEANHQGSTSDELPFMLDGFIAGKAKSNSCH